MKLSWNCLNELINLKTINILKIANKLTLAGFETEQITYNSQICDTIFDIKITANRQDIKSIIDIALEISAITNTDLNIDTNIEKNYHQYNLQTERIENSKIDNDFTQLSFSIIKNIYVYHNNQRIINNLLAHDVKPTHTILDFINFINIKWGQKLNIYTVNTTYNDENISNIHVKNHDIDKLSKNHIIYLNNQQLKIVDENHIKNTQQLNTIIIATHEFNNHSTYYNNKSIKTSPNRNWLLYAYKEIFDFLKLNQEVYPTIHIKHSLLEKSQNILCSIDKINNILGPIHKKQKHLFLNKSEIINTLDSLRFKTFADKNKIEICIPKARKLDLERDIDIIEEIGRIYGFNSFLDQLPDFHYTTKFNKTQSIEQKIRKVLRSMGLHEVINYSLYNYINSNCIQLVNPLNKDQKFLRTNLVSNLIEAKIYNKHQSNNVFEVFEIGKVFYYGQQNLRSENLHIGGLLGNKKFNQLLWDNQTDELSWFQAKGHLEELFEKINANIKWNKYSKPNNLIHSIQKYLHIRRTVYITYKNQTIGLFSQLNNKTQQALGTKYNLYIFEINIHKLIESIKTKQDLQKTYIAYSQYPKIIRDSSIKVGQNISLQYIINITNTIKKRNNHVFESIKILNEYHEANNTKQISLRTTYRSRNKTLTNKEIKILDNIFKNNIHLAIEGKESKT